MTSEPQKPKSVSPPTEVKALIEAFGDKKEADGTHNRFHLEEALECLRNACGGHLEKRVDSLCAVCGISMPNSLRTKKYCSDFCSRNAYYKRKGIEKVNYIKKLCFYCGKSFLPKQGNQKYCRPICRWEDYNFGVVKDKFLSTRFEILQRDGHKCMYCGRTPELHNIVLAVDHIIPASKGGETKKSNLITSCQECNVGKGSRDILLYLNKNLVD
jgi:5-methylcytosine-specific restriction endonuclease McrA